MKLPFEMNLKRKFIILGYGEIKETHTYSTKIERGESSGYYPDIKVNFIPYQENESFENFIKRFEVYIKILGAEHKE